MHISGLIEIHLVGLDHAAIVHLMLVMPVPKNISKHVIKISLKFLNLEFKNNFHTSGRTRNARELVKLRPGRPDLPILQVVISRVGWLDLRENPRQLRLLWK
jgi:hypothetical protein